MPQPRRRLALLFATAATAITVTSPLTITPAVSAAPKPGLTATPSASLESISCPRADLCLAVGEQFGRRPGTSRGLSELWNGKHWRVIPMPSVRGARLVDLADVTCLSAKNCVAVGIWETPRFQAHGLIASWNGTRWQLPHLSIPAGELLASVSCVSGVCMITGVRGVHASKAVPAAMQLRGTRLRLLKPPDPRGKSFAALAGVSCTRPASCLAVGEAHPGQPGSSFTDLAETWNGIHWRIAKIPRPKASTVLDGVSCPDATECLAVGSPGAGTGRPLTLALVSKNGRWRRLVPTGGKPSGLFITTPLTAISCASPSSCVAVGSGGAQGSAVWNGKKLRYVPTPAENGQFEGISCVSPTRCIAVGGRFPGIHEAAMAALWNGRSWKPVPISG